MKGRVSLWLVSAALILTQINCGPSPAPSPPTGPEGAVTALPPPHLSGDLSLEETLARRRSVREFTRAPLTAEQIGQLAWAAQGITGSSGFRTAPSAGALYPLELYVATQHGVFHYQPDGHKLLVLSGEDARRGLYRVALDQEAVRDGAALFIVAAVYQRTEEKYGQDRGPRYVHLEAGHAAQNLLLEAVALGLGAVVIGAFDDAGVQQVLGLPADHQPLYLIPVGRPTLP